MQTINERLASLPGLLGYDSPAALAKAAGIDPNTMRKAMQGPSKPSYDTLEAITSRWPKLSAAWLLSGKGEPISDGGAKSTDPFLPGGRLTHMGATAMSGAAMDAVLGEGFGEDTDGKRRAKQLPTNATDFIKGLLDEIEVLKKDKHNLLTIQTEQQQTIRHNQKMIDFLQKQVEQLQVSGKLEGNQLDAPGLTIAAEPIRPIGFGRGADVVDTVCAIRRMWPNGLPEEALAELQQQRA